MAAFFVPWVPRLAHTPQVRYNDYGAGAECAMFGAALIALAFVVACFGSRSAEKRDYWPKVALVGLGWMVALNFVPI